MSETLTLCYHALSTSWPAPLAATPAAFEEQLELLLSRGYEPATFTAAARAEGPDRAFVITFDDAFRSVLELAAPVMRRLGVPGTVFVPTAYPDSGRPMAWEGLDAWLDGPHHAELACMSWDELRALQGAGWEVASHTHSHPYLTRLGYDDLLDELRLSRTVCERELGRPCVTLAYPYGDTDERVIDAASDAGYLYAAALDARFRTGDPLRLPRIGIYRQDDLRRFGLKTARSLRAVRSSPAWQGVVAARRAAAAQRARGAAVIGPHAEVSVALAMDLSRLT
jgi:peptidoglycan/xylan/chitin deacetylase (PgdA/CDA1 family)